MNEAFLSNSKIPRYRVQTSGDPHDPIGQQNYLKSLARYLKTHRKITLTESYYLYGVEEGYPKGPGLTALNETLRGIHIVDLPPFYPGKSKGPLSHASIKGAKRLPWHVLPAGRCLFSEVRSHFEKLSKERPDKQWDLTRLDFAEFLKPRECWIGNGEFHGYVCFIFSWTQAALLENPIRGNAIYVLHQEWKLLSQLSKFDLLSKHNSTTTRVVHTLGWKRRGEHALRFGHPVKKPTTTSQRK